MLFEFDGKIKSDSSDSRRNVLGIEEIQTEGDRDRIISKSGLT